MISPSHLHVVVRIAQAAEEGGGEGNLIFSQSQAAYRDLLSQRLDVDPDAPKKSMTGAKGDMWKGMIKRAVRYLLLQNARRSRVVRWSELRKEAIGQIMKPGNVKKDLLRCVQWELQNVFGLQLVPVVRPSVSENKVTELNAESNAFVLVSRLQDESIKRILAEAEGTHVATYRGIAMFVISLILSQPAHRMPLDLVKKYMAKADPSCGTDASQLAGEPTPRPALDVLVASGVLARVRDREAEEEDEIEFLTLGPRARAELGARNGYEFMVKTLGLEDISERDYELWVDEERPKSPLDDEEMEEEVARERGQGAAPAASASSAPASASASAAPAAPAAGAGGSGGGEKRPRRQRAAKNSEPRAKRQKKD